MGRSMNALVATTIIMGGATACGGSAEPHPGPITSHSIFQPEATCHEDLVFGEVSSLFALNAQYSQKVGPAIDKLSTYGFLAARVLNGTAITAKCDKVLNENKLEEGIPVSVPDIGNTYSSDCVALSGLASLNGSTFSPSSEAAVICPTAS